SAGPATQAAAAPLLAARRWDAQLHRDLPPAPRFIPAASLVRTTGGEPPASSSSACLHPRELPPAVARGTGDPGGPRSRIGPSRCRACPGAMAQIGFAVGAGPGEMGLGQKRAEQHVLRADDWAGAHDCRSALGLARLATLSSCRFARGA